MNIEQTLKQISVDHLVWSVDKGQHTILNDVNALLTSGEFYGILGPNGAGKTSIVRQILHLQESTSGSVKMDEKDVKNIRREEMASMVSFLPQNIKSDVDFSVFDVVAMGREPHRKRFTPLNEEDKNKIEAAMRYTNCLHMKDKSISFLSGGERQRVMIARAIAQDTPWIILDEPVSALDVRHQADLMVALEELRHETGKTVIAILHDLNLSAAFCTRIILMKKGQIYKAGPTREVFTKETLEHVYEMEFELLDRGKDQMPFISPKFSALHFENR